MADYHPLIARAVAGLDKNTGDGRRTIYERARTALVAQLRSVEPPLNETDITRERLALEEAIRKVETEAARKARSESARADAPAKVRAPDPKRWEAAARWDEPAPPSLDPPAAPGRKAVPPPAWRRRTVRRPCRGLRRGRGARLLARVRRRMKRMRTTLKRTRGDTAPRACLPFTSSCGWRRRFSSFSASAAWRHGSGRRSRCS